MILFDSDYMDNALIEIEDDMTFDYEVNTDDVVSESVKELIDNLSNSFREFLKKLGKMLVGIYTKIIGFIKYLKNYRHKQRGAFNKASKEVNDFEVEVEILERAELLLPEGNEERVRNEFNAKMGSLLSYNGYEIKDYSDNIKEVLAAFNKYTDWVAENLAAISVLGVATTEINNAEPAGKYLERTIRRELPNKKETYRLDDYGHLDSILSTNNQIFNDLEEVADEHKKFAITWGRKCDDTVSHLERKYKVLNDQIMFVGENNDKDMQGDMEMLGKIFNSLIIFERLFSTPMTYIADVNANTLKIVTDIRKYINAEKKEAVSRMNKALAKAVSDTDDYNRGAMRDLINLINRSE